MPAIPPSVDPDAKPVPVEPSEPAPAPDVLPAPANEKYPQHPEAVVIVDKQSESFSDLAVRAQVRRVLDRLLAERPGLIVRMLDVRDARQYPVAPRELPAVLTTSEGRLETKIDRTLLPVVAAEPPPFHGKRSPGCGQRVQLGRSRGAADLGRGALSERIARHAARSCSSAMNSCSRSARWSRSC